MHILHQKNAHCTKFNEDQIQIDKICKGLLYIDFYSRIIFQLHFDSENRSQLDAMDRMTFAHTARTICIAFVVFVARYHKGNIKGSDLQTIFNASNKDTLDPLVYELMKNLDGVDGLFPNLFDNKDKYDELLYQLFMMIINSGIMCYTMASKYEEALNASNYLKKDKNYYIILVLQWRVFQIDIETYFAVIIKIYYK